MALPTGPLSSNWKILQKRLSANLEPTKRKPAPPEGSPDNKPKRQRLNEHSGPRKPDEKKTQKTSNPHTSSMPAFKQPHQAMSAASLALWAEENNIPAADLARAYDLPLIATGVPTATAASTVPTTIADPEPEGSNIEVGKYIAIDCEMVGVAREGGRERSALARVSVVNFHGHCVLDRFVKPKERVTDWRTWVSGVSPKDMVNALTFEEAQQKVSELMKDRILIGHAIKHDLDCLLIGHPKRDIRDTSLHRGFRKYNKGRTPGLKKLAKDILGIEIQGRSHSSVEDAMACMLLYRLFKDDFEREQNRFPNHPKKLRESKKSGESKELGESKKSGELKKSGESKELGESKESGESRNSAELKKSGESKKKNKGKKSRK